MFSKENMAWLSDNYRIGIGVISGIVIIIYILITVFAIRHVYKKKGYIAIKGTIPILHLFLFLVGREKKVKPKKEKKQKQSSENLNNSETQQDSSNSTTIDNEDNSVLDLDEVIDLD